jgi:bacillithiol synthase
MDCSASRMPYRQTNSFSKIILDYIDQAAALKPFFAYPPSRQGIQKAIGARKQQGTDRELLVQQLKKQYAGVPASEPVQKNIEALLSATAFTVTTAHQNNIFTGPVFFIYKILHTIRLADHLSKVLPGNQFVPVFYMGTEDADLEELNHIYLHEEKLVWNTQQTGAVGRMKVDKELTKLIELINGQLSVLPKGDEIISLVKDCYKEGMTLQEATFRIVNALFAGYGLVIVLPDNPVFKKQMLAIFEDEIFHQSASGIVEKTAENLESAGYKAQVNPREINLFYLKDDIRERIIKEDAPETGFNIQHTSLRFSEKEMKDELQTHPERFSPNVILRGLYQETILPNIAFIGGGGELSYWLQLKGLFEHYKTPYPVLVLRNSFLILEKKWESMISKMGFIPEDFFLPEQELINRLVTRESGKKLQLNGTLTETERLYEEIKKQAASIDITLEKHVDSLRMKTLHHLQELQKKMLRAEKRKFSDQQRQIHTVKKHLFPGNDLQERRENILYYYSKWGKDLLDMLYEQSLQLEQEFVVVVPRLEV